MEVEFKDRSRGRVAIAWNFEDGLILIHDMMKRNGGHMT